MCVSEKPAPSNLSSKLVFFVFVGRDGMCRNLGMGNSYP